MRSICITALVCALALMAVVTGVSRAQAQQPIQLLNWDATWRYNQTDTNLGTTWIPTNYNDSAWPSGSGLLGYEDSDPYPYPVAWFTTLSLTNVYFDDNHRIPTYLLRTTFNFPSNVTAGWTLVASNYIDDGAVVYLNGAEIYRYGVPASQNFFTYANRTATEGQADVTNLIATSTSLRRGTNYLAVELHQVNATSSDIIYGLSLWAIPPAAPTITNHPVGLTVEAGTNVTFSVDATGSMPLSYQWYKNSTPISGATNDTYALTYLGPLNSGTYSVVVSNSFGRATSSNAVLNVFCNRIGITDQPDSQTIILGQSATFTVGVTGSIPAFQWYMVAGGVTNTLANATNASYTKASTIVADSNTVYYVRITNFANVVFSSPAVLKVVPDTFGPLLLSAIVNEGDTNKIYVNFNETVGTLSSKNVTNYQLCIVGTNNLLTTNMLTITNIQPNGSQVLLTLSSNFVFRDTNEYVLIVNNITDTRSNAVAPNSWIGVSFARTTNVIAFGSPWVFDNNEFFDMTDTNAASTTNWVAINYTPSYPNHWVYDPTWSGFYYFTQLPGSFYPACSDGGFDVGLGPRTFYYRKSFVITNDLGTNVTATLTNAVDDGAVFYLNGVELTRVRMPAGPINYFTLASQTNSGVVPCQSGTFQVGPLLVRGTNVLAVEVHQAQDPDPQNDTGFDAALKLSYVSTATWSTSEQSPRLRVTRGTGGTMNVQWFWGHGYALEWTPALRGSNNTDWVQQQPGMSTNMVISTTNAAYPARAFRLRKIQ